MRLVSAEGAHHRRRARYHEISAGSVVSNDVFCFGAWRCLGRNPRNEDEILRSGCACRTNRRESREERHPAIKISTAHGARLEGYATRDVSNVRHSVKDN